MKTVSQILIVVLIVGGIIGGIVYFLMSRGSGSTTGTGSPTLFNQMQTYVGSYSDSIEGGWSDDYLTTINVYVASHKAFLTPAQISTINDKVQVTFLEALDNLIRSYYGPSMTSGSYADNPKLLCAYKGLDATAAQYPDIKSLPAWSKLKNLKSAHEAIYNFGQKSHTVQPRLKPSLKWNGSVPEGVKHGNLFNYNSYRNQQESTRTSLSAKCNAFTELRSSPWTTLALSKEQLDATIDVACTAYRTGEQLAIDGFAASMMPDIQRHITASDRFTKEQGTPFLGALDSFITILSNDGYSTSSLQAARDSYRRVYLTD